MFERACLILVLVAMSGCTQDNGGFPDAATEERFDGDDGTSLSDEPFVDGDEGGADPEGADPDGDSGPEIWRPAPGTSWQWQLTGTIDTQVGAEMYDIDLFESPQEVIDQLHAQGRVVICYFSAGSREDWRPDAGDFPGSAVGNELDGWPGERWIDTRDETVRSIMSARMDLAVTKSCDGVEPDNVDAYTNDPGFPLFYPDQLEYNRFLAEQAHARGLSVGLKNDLDQVEDLIDDFDWALNEECFSWDECDTLLPFIQAGKAVFHVEYGGAGLADTICPQANALGFDTLIKNWDLDAWRVPCR